MVWSEYLLLASLTYSTLKDCYSIKAWLEPETVKVLYIMFMPIIVIYISTIKIWLETRQTDYEIVCCYPK